jgi:hypothetical protein
MTLATRRAARGVTASGGETRTVKTETLRPFAAPFGSPECSIEPWPDRKSEGTTAFESPAKRRDGDAAIAATSPVDVNMPFETSRTTRGSDPARTRDGVRVE